MSNNKYNLIFTDVDNTLLGTDYVLDSEKNNKDIDSVMHQYIRRMKQPIENILMDNNILILVSSLDHAYKVSDKLASIYNSINEEYKNKLFLFESSAGEMIDYLNSNIFNYNGVRINLILHKTEALDYMINYCKEKNIQINTIYGLGDDKNDVDLLLKIKNMGGNVGIVGYRKWMYLQEEIEQNNIDNICSIVAERVFHFERQCLIREKTNLCGNAIESLNIIKKVNDKIVIKQENLSNELKKNYLSGKLTKEDLQKIYMIHSLALNCTHNYNQERYNEVLELADNYFEFTLDQEASLGKKNHMLKKIMQL